MIGQKVIHKSWGIGTITETSGATIKVAFGDQQNKFIYSDAFENFLTSDNPIFILI